MSMQDSDKPFVYLLLCSWLRIPANKSAQEPINVIGGDPYEVKDHFGKKTFVYPLAFNTELVKEQLLNERNQSQQLALIDMALEFIKDQRRVRIATDAMYEFCSESLIGSVDSLYASFHFKPFDPEAEMKEYLGDLGPDKTDLLDRITKSKTGDNGDNSGDNNEEGEDELKELKLKPDNPSGKILIEESNQPIVTVDPVNRRIKVEIRIPNVKSIAELELDLSETVLHLEIPSVKSFKTVDVVLPQAVAVGTCNAKLIRKKMILVVVVGLK